MKNITVTVPDEIYLIARVHAARQGTSVSSLVRQFLESLDESRFSGLAFLDDEEGEATPSPLFPVEL